MAISKSKPVSLVVHDVHSVRPDTPGVPFRQVWCADHHFTGPWPCGCAGGPQHVGMTSEADEIGSGGARGGSKTELLLAWTAFKGNPTRAGELIRAGKPVTGANVMYIAHRNYRGLILREQANDLGDLLDRAEEMYGPTGATISRGSPAMAKWSTGAAILFGHFGDNGWKKYIGPQYQRIGIDQAEMMESKEIHDRIIGSCRSKWPDLIPQVMLTFNPGGGDEASGAPGQAWLMEYFRIEAYLNGKAPKNAIIRYPDGKTVQFIASKVSDNPYLKYRAEKGPAGELLCQNCGQQAELPVASRRAMGELSAETRKKTGFDENFPAADVAVCARCDEPLLKAGSYYKWLNSIEPESLRRAWRDGDWNALTGQYFRDFRPNGHLVGEPDNANHVYKPETVRLEPWLKRWISVDWGYIHPSAIHWHAKAPTGQVFTYREILVNRVEPMELGIMIARESRADLEGLKDNPHMVIFLSPDAYYKKESENTSASKIVMGINKELGPGSAFLADLTDAEREMKDAEEALRSMHRRRAEQVRTRITVVRASDDRVHGWMHLQSMLRFRPLSKHVEPDKEYAARLYSEGGLVKYLEYMGQPEFKAPQEIIPRWQIDENCRYLIRGLKEAMHKPGTNDVLKVDATETRAGDDAIDGARYGLYSEEAQKESIAPLETRVTGRVEALKEQMPGLSTQSLWMAERTARAAETKQKRADEQFNGRNRLAVRRAFLAHRHGQPRERTLA